MSSKKMQGSLLLGAALVFCGGSVQAVELGGVDLSGSGFMTLVAGKMLGGTRGGEAADLPRPIFVSDYAQGGIYDGRSGIQWQPDTKVGLQGTATLPNKDLSITGQVVSRGARNGDVNLEWLYAGYKLNDAFTLQVGRKRIPMFYYSDTQDVGFALPWTHLPSGPYGWQAVNYNGINLAYQGQWGDWTSSINVMAGSETFKNSGYWKVYNGKHSRTNVRWDDILGGDITLAKDWLETRFVYLQSKMRTKNLGTAWDPGTDSYVPLTDPTDYNGPSNKQRIYGLALNIDRNNWIVRSEAIYIDHDRAFEAKDRAYLLAVGYRYGKWTPMITFSDYHAQAISSVAASDAQEATRMTSLTLRYDLTTSSDVKIQFDSQRDRSGPNYTLDAVNGGVMTNRYGNSRLLTVAYDMVF